GGHTLSVFPNPTYGLVRVEISGEMPEHPINVTLTDVNGKRLQNFTTESPYFDVDLISYVQGNYLLLVLIDDKKSVWKIIKQ
ncbi:MAG: T9SS type A sorting domain-containing protein, partial [Prevotellaceae bacterium]|nr:T9SS type A sorting domain-containing protein [Prevotellaceae bacterium]